jgi:hypothetical protein
MTRTTIAAGDVYSRYDKTRRADAAAYGRKVWLALAASGLFAATAAFATAAGHIAAAAIN